MQKLYLRLLLTLTLLCASSGFAQTLINQSNISSFPYVISIPGSYKLTSNLAVTTPGTDAIYIVTNDVTLDLGGYTISGPLVCNSASCNVSSTSMGVSANNAGAVVQNGFIKGFEYCVMQYMGRVQDLTVSSCQTSISAVIATVHHNVVTGCMYAGIQAYYSVISENSVYGNGNYGVISEESSILNNTILNNTQTGLYFGYGVYSGNTIISNGTDISNFGGAVSTKDNACTSGAC
jgi:hypothetical protein